MATAYAAPIGSSFSRESARMGHGQKRPAAAKGAPSVRACREHGSPAPSVRLTRRARLIVLLVITAAVVVLGPWRAIASAPEGVVPQGWSTVVVQPGDTLWTLAERIDPAGDPRVIVADIKQANSLANSAIAPGQVLTVPAP